MKSVSLEKKFSQIFAWQKVSVWLDYK